MVQHLQLLVVAEQATRAFEPMNLPLSLQATASPSELQTALHDLRAEHLRFKAMAVDNPEEDADAVSATERAFSEAEAALEARDFDRMREACVAIVGDRSVHLRALQTMGPTALASVNRAIFHLTHQSRFAPAALALLEALPERLTQDLDRRQVQVATRAHAEAAAGDIAASREVDPLVEAAGRLTSALRAYVEAESQNGPTPNPQVNLVLNEAQVVWDREGTWPCFALFLQDVQATVGTASPMQGPLEAMRRAALTSDAEALQAAYAMLEALDLSKPDWDEDEDLVFDFMQEAGGRETAEALMPKHFEYMLDIVEAYLTNPSANHEQAYHSLDRMTFRVAEVRKMLGKASPTHKFRGPGEAAVTLLEEAVQSLRKALGERSRSALDKARGQMAEAAEVLGAVKSGR